jgi:glycosyltransferase involved in cell wall biosynthesis
MGRPHAEGSGALRVIIVIENMSYTFDTRVRNIARTLERSGSRVWVICPRYPGDPLKRVEGGVTIYFYPLPPLPGGLLGHVLEYLYSFASISVATLIAFFRVRFDVIHVCNPPDIFFPLGWLYRLLGRKFVFDQHDLCPELWQVRYRESRLMLSVLLTLERLTLTAANHVIVTSETARERIFRRAGVRRSHVTLVRNGPDLANFPAATEPAPTNVVEVGYIGDMNPQDGIDHLLRAASHIHHKLGRTDVRFVLIGDGSASDVLRQHVETLRLSECVQFTGRMRNRDAMQRLSACTLCVQPDLKNAFNDACVMVKSLEYMALGKPLVAFDLEETRRICGNAALYATHNDHENLATAILTLADDAPLRRRLGEIGRQQIEQGLAWSYSERQLLKVYARLRRNSKRHSRHAGESGRLKTVFAAAGKEITHLLAEAAHFLAGHKARWGLVQPAGPVNGVAQSPASTDLPLPHLRAPSGMSTPAIEGRAMDAQQSARRTLARGVYPLPLCRSIVMVGSDVSTPGGMSSVIRQYQEGGLFDSYRCVYVPTHRNGSKISKTWTAIAGGARASWYLLTCPKPLLHVHMSYSGSFWRKSVMCMIAAAMLRPYIVHMHGSQFMEFYGRCGPGVRRFMRYMFGHAAVVIALSHEWRTNLLRVCPDARIEVLPNGVSLPDLRTRPPETCEPHIVCLGRIGARKGTFELVQAFARLASRYPRWRLTCAGDGEVDELRAVAEQAGLRDRVIIPGWVSPERAREIIATATIFALPSHAEGLPMALLEAMSWSLPVVTSRVGGIPDVIRHDRNGLLIEPGDIDALAESLERLMADADQRARLGLSARQTIENAYSREVMLRQLMGIYERFGIVSAEASVS